MNNLRKSRRGISILIEAVVVTILIIGAFSVAYYYSTPANTRLQRSQNDISQTAYNILSSLARAHEFDQTIINGEKIIRNYSNCQFHSPNIAVAPASIWSQPGGIANYVITLVNNDTSCGNELFRISVSLPSPFWNFSLPQTLVTVPSNGGTVSMQISVMSPRYLGNMGKFTIGINVLNIASNAPSSEASAVTNVYYIVNSNIPCIYNTPGINVQPNSQSSAPNATVSYAVVVSNNDNNCGMEGFQIAVRPLANWTGSVAQSMLQIGSQNNASTTLNEALTSSSSLAKGVLVTVSNAANPYSQSSVIIGYTNQNSTTTCSNTYTSNPSLSGKPANSVVQPGGNVSTAIVIGIGDKNGCAESFTLSASVQNGATGWSVSLSTQAVTLVEPPGTGNGPKGGFTLYVTAQPNASPKTVTVTVSAISNQKSTLKGNLALSFTLGSQLTCVRYNPTVAINPPNLWSTNDSSNTYYLTVTNNNNMSCDSGLGTFNVSVTAQSQLQISTNQTLNISDEKYVTVPIIVTSSSSAEPGQSYNFSITVIDNANSSVSATATSYFYVIPQCLNVTYSCLQQIPGALYPNWQHNLNVALASLIPKGYIYNLTVYLVYAPPDNPFNAKLILLNGNQQITDASIQAFINAGNVASATYTYTTPSLLMLQFNLQLAEVTSP